MKKSVFSLLLCLAMVFAMLPVLQADATTVKEVRIKDVILPVHGSHPSYTASAEHADALYEVYAGGYSEASHNGVRWRDVTQAGHYINMGASDTFEYGHTYEVCVAVAIKDKNQDSFQLGGADNLPQIRCYINGTYTPNAAYPIEGVPKESYFCIAYKYECGPNMLENVGVYGVVAPSAGKAPDYNSATTGRIDYIAAIPPQSDRSTLVRWYDNTAERYLDATDKNDRFTQDHVYTASVTLCTAEFSGSWQFHVDAKEQPAVSATLNGETAQAARVFGYSARNCIELSYTFGPCKTGAQIIHTIDLGGLNVPYADTTPDYGCGSYTAGVTSTGYEYHDLFHNGISWYDLTLNADLLTDGTAFVEGHRYRVQIEVQAKPGYEFDVVNGSPVCTATLNGAKATVHENLLRDDPTRILEIWYEFPACTPGTVELEKVDVAGVSAPVVGELPVNYAVSATQGCYVDYDFTIGTLRYSNGVRWSDVTGAYDTPVDGPFEAGHKYRVEVQLKTEDYFAFAGNGAGVQLTLNGMPAAHGDNNGESTANWMVVSYTFPALAEQMDDDITEVEVNVDYPVVGTKLGYGHTLPPSAGYHVEAFTDGNYQGGVAWFDQQTGYSLPVGTVAEENVAYQAYILLIADEGKQFAPTVSAMVNGEAATTELLGDTLIVYRTFYANPADPTVNPFADVQQSDFFYDPVLWAYYHTPQITTGTSANKFSPTDTCTRGQVVTFLWRAKGCPEPGVQQTSFTDLAAGSYYYKAVLWAVESGVTSGQDAAHFGPNDGCTRAQVVTFLWRAEGKPAPTSSANPFTDVPADKYYTDAVLWAVEKKVTNGLSATTFGPEATCTRGQIVTFLYRDLG